MSLNLILDLYRNDWRKDDFSVFYSGLDLFDVALNSGVGKNLDGMFTCTPYNSKKMYEGYKRNINQIHENSGN